MGDKQRVRVGRLNRREAMARMAATLTLSTTFAASLAAAGAQRPTQAAPPRRRTVQTVTGAIDLAKLGFTLSHEHICAASAGLWQAWPELFGGRAQLVRIAVEQLRQARDEGIDTLIDVTTIDLGRDVRLLEEVSRKSGLQVIACTGHWLDPSRSMNARTVEELTEFFVREIERGIEGTDIRAGIIKVANGGMIDAFGEKLLRAAARASKATGVPITTHSPGGDRVGEKQAATGITWAWINFRAGALRHLAPRSSSRGRCPGTSGTRRSRIWSMQGWRIASCSATTIRLPCRCSRHRPIACGLLRTRMEFSS